MRFKSVLFSTWYGYVSESTGPGQIYESDSTPMISYINTRVIVVDPKDYGKSTICRILSGYTARLDRSPVLVNLDVGQRFLSIPGCLCASSVSKMSLSIEEGTHLVYYYGSTTPSDNSRLYMQLASTLASRVDGRLDRDADARASWLCTGSSSIRVTGLMQVVMKSCYNVLWISPLMSA